jgi:uncharacterized membrane protein
MEHGVEFSLYCRGVFRKDDGMNVKCKRHAGIAEFLYAIHRVQPSCHADLEDVLAKRSDIRYDIYVSSAGLFCHGLCSLVLCVCLSKLCFKLCHLCLKAVKLWANRLASSRLCLVEERLVASLLSLCLLRFCLESFFFAKLATKLGLLLLFLLLLVAILMGET